MISDFHLHCSDTQHRQCGTVGFGGYTLGGGVGFATGEHGLSSDNIISATVVLANGVIVEANEDDHPDLLWGLKGGEW